MTSLILWGLIAFLIVDVLALVLVLRWNDRETKADKESPIIHRGAIETPVPVAQTAQANIPDTNVPDEATTSMTTSSRPVQGEHVFTFDLAHDESDARPVNDGNPPSVATAMPLSKNGMDDEQTSRERSFLRQKASSLETRIAALNESSEATTDYQRGMRAILEEELHATWTRLGELESESGRTNHVSAK